MKTKPAIQKFTQHNPSLLELFSTVQELHEIFLKNKANGMLTMVDVRIKQVNIVDFFKALNFFKKLKECPIFEIKGPKGELLAYCFHYRPTVEDDFSVMIVSELHEQVKVKDFNKHPIGPFNAN